MSTLTVRRLPDEVHRALRAQAAAEGISAEEKARRILAGHVLPEASGGLGRELGVLVDELDLAGDGLVSPQLSEDVEPALLHESSEGLRPLSPPDVSRRAAWWGCRGR